MAARDAALMRTAVIGVGYLGRFHAQKYKSLAGSELIGVADPSREARAAVAAELGVPRDRRLPRAAGRRRCGQHRDADAAALRDCQGIPRIGRARAGGEADDRHPGGGGEPDRGGACARIAFCRSGTWSASTRRYRRCNPSSRCRDSSSRRGSRRSSSAAPTSNVVLDLMIHDIDLILSIVRSPVVSVDAIGSSVFSQGDRHRQCAPALRQRLRRERDCEPREPEDRAQAAAVPGRRLRVGRSAAEGADGDSKDAGVGADGMPQVDIEETSYDQGDALNAEIEAFLAAAAAGREPPVTGEDGLKALKVALTITEQVAASMSRFA